MNEDVFKGKISEDFYKNTVNDGRYDDIIDMAHHVSKDRPHMSQADEIEREYEPEYAERELLPDE